MFDGLTEAEIKIKELKLHCLKKRYMLYLEEKTEFDNRFKKLLETVDSLPDDERLYFELLEVK